MFRSYSIPFPGEGGVSWREGERIFRPARNLSFKSLFMLNSPLPSLSVRAYHLLSYPRNPKHYMSCSSLPIPRLFLYSSYLFNISFLVLSQHRKKQERDLTLASVSHVVYFTQIVGVRLEFII